MKIFVVSDIHGFFDIFIKNLKEKGFEENNPNHLLVCCGDYFDRGKQPIEVMEYLMSLNNVVLIKGNHEDLLLEMLHRGYPLSHDIHNGTVETIARIIEDKNFTTYNEVENYIKPFIDRMVDYFETENYVFVHGWIPKNSKVKTPNWRLGDWEEARWLNGMEFNHKGFNPTNKTVVCGHWHCSWGWSHIAQKYKEFPQLTSKTFRESFLPYIEEGIIAIDACTAYSGLMNIGILEETVKEE